MHLKQRERKYMKQTKNQSTYTVVSVLDDLLFKEPEKKKQKMKEKKKIFTV